MKSAQLQQAVLLYVLLRRFGKSMSSVPMGSHPATVVPRGSSRSQHSAERATYRMV